MSPSPKPVEIDFLEYDRTMQRGSGGRALLLKAVGLNKQAGVRILDGTAGLMRDAFYLAKFGGDVTAIERNPQLCKMITQALLSLPQGIALSFLAGNACDLIPQLDQFSVIYLDPMFREVKSAKAKKDLQFLQSLHQDEPDESEALFLVALQYAKRVVVKRSKHAKPLAGKMPSFQLQGQSIRFDVYVIASASNNTGGRA